MTAFHLLLLGALAMATLAVAIIFLRYWRDSGDRLFLYFALSFFVQAVNRVALGLASNASEAHPWHYLVRFIAYVLIVAGILHKNRRVE